MYFFHLPPTSSQLYPLQGENCDSNSRLVVDEDDNSKYRLERDKALKYFCITNGDLRISFSIGHYAFLFLSVQGPSTDVRIWRLRLTSKGGPRAEKVNKLLSSIVYALLPHEYDRWTNVVPLSSTVEQHVVPLSSTVEQHWFNIGSIKAGNLLLTITYSHVPH